MNHCFPFLNGSKIKHESAETCHDADVIVITAGALPRENGTRADVLKDNVAIFQSILPALAQNNPNAYLLNITNPVDAMAYAAGKIAGFQPQKVVGTGTALDSMRLSQFTAEMLSLDSRALQIPIIGEHGDSMVPLWSLAQYQGQLFDATQLSAEQKAQLLHQTKRAGWDIRLAGEHSCYAIAFSAVRIIDKMFNACAEPILVSCESTKDTYQLPNTFISLPTTFDSNGISQRIYPDITAEERHLLEASAAVVAQQLIDVQRYL